MATTLEDDKIILALKQTLQHISLQQSKFKDIDSKLQQTKQELETEKNHYSKQCSELKIELKHFKSLSEKQALIISEMKMKSAKLTKQNTLLSENLSSQLMFVDEMKMENENNSLPLIKQLRKENATLQKEISRLKSKLNTQQIDDDQLKRLQNENVTLQQQISEIQRTEMTELKQEIDTRHKIEKEYCEESAVIKHENKILKQQNLKFQKSEKDTRVKCQNYRQRMSGMGKCALNMLQNCRSLRRSISDTATHMLEHSRKIESEFGESLQKLTTMKVCQRNKSQTQSNENKYEMSAAIEKKLKSVKNTKIVLNELRTNVQTELSNFNKEIKSVQRRIFKQKSMLCKQRKDCENAQRMKLEQSLENEQNMKERLREYLRMKDELQSKISGLESNLKHKNEKDIITEMKRFRSAAIVTSVHAISDKDSSISYHKLNKFEKKAISLKAKIEKQIRNDNSEINMNEKVSEFIRCGGLKRYSILETQFKHEPTETDQNRFRFGSKFISLSYNAKQNALYVKSNNIENVQLLQDWISKNASNEMRKLLSKVSQKKKANKRIVEPKIHVL